MRPYDAAAQGHRPHLPERRAVPRHDDPRQHHDRARCCGCAAASSGRRSTTGRRRGGARAPRLVERIIDFLEIEAIRKVPVGQPAYGLQKRVELGRALAMEPELLLLDEPMAGMNVEEKEDMCRFILDVNDEFGTTIALIEHDMGVVMDISDRVVVLDYGRKIADGAPDEVRATRTSSPPIWASRMGSAYDGAFGPERTSSRRQRAGSGDRVVRHGYPPPGLHRPVRADGHGAGSSGAGAMGRPASPASCMR